MTIMLLKISRPIIYPVTSGRRNSFYQWRWSIGSGADSQVELGLIAFFLKTSYAAFRIGPNVMEATRGGRNNLRTSASRPSASSKHRRKNSNRLSHWPTFSKTFGDTDVDTWKVSPVLNTSMLTALVVTVTLFAVGPQLQVQHIPIATQPIRYVR